MPGYIGNDPAGSATKIARQTYTTSGAATTDFTFTSGYDVGYLDLYIDGVRQTKGTNFTASDGSTFRVLNGGVGTGSTVEAIAYKTFNLATVDFDDLGNTGNLTLSGDISAVDATFSGDVSIGGTLTYEDVTSIDSVGIITARSDVSIADKIIHTGDTNTAIRFPAADTFTVETGGSERVRVDSSGIVTTTNTLKAADGHVELLLDSGNGRIKLNNSSDTTNIDLFGSNGSATFKGDLTIADKIIHDGDTNTAIRFPAADTFTVETSGSEAIRVSSAGSFGIGTNDPEDNLHVFTNANDEGILVKSTGSTSNALDFDANRSGAGNGLASIRGKWNGTTVAQISFLAGDDTTNKDDGVITFGTESAASGGNVNATERMRITSGGNVRIGSTAGGTQPLCIAKDDSTGVNIQFQNSTTGTTSNDGVLIGLSGAEDGQFWNYENNNLLFGTNNNERMRITSDGDVGIGTDSVDRRLHVQSGVNTTDGAFRIESANGNIMDMGTDGTGHFINCVNTDPFRIKFAGTEILRATSDGDLLVGTDTNGGGNRLYVVDNFTDSFVNPSDSVLRVENANDSGTTTQASISFTSQTSGSNADSAIVSQAEDGSGNSSLQFWTDTSNGMSEKMRITSNSEVKITGGEGVSAALHLIADQGDDDGDSWRIISNQDANDLTISNDDSGSFSDLFTFTKAGMLGVGHGSPQFGITLAQTNERVSKIGWEDSGNQVRASIACSSSTDALQFFTGTGDNEAGRFTNDQCFLMVQEGTGGQAHLGTQGFGVDVQSGNMNGVMISKEATNWGTALYINRTSNAGDGMLIEFAHGNVTEGQIDISGNDVTYGQFCGSHWGRLEDNSKPEILLGTILETINKAIEWKVVEFEVNGEQKRQAYNGSEENGASVTVEYEGVSYTGTVADEVPDSENLNKHVCVKVSDTAASKAVFGVFLGWNTSGEDQVIGTWNDMNIAALGNYYIRIKSGQSLEIGDLIESDGTGCGVVQSDDIIRSKTVAKVTSTTPLKVYTDGSFLVTCVLYCG